MSGCSARGERWPRGEGFFWRLGRWFSGPEFWVPAWGSGGHAEDSLWRAQNSRLRSLVCILKARGIYWRVLSRSGYKIRFVIWKGYGQLTEGRKRWNREVQFKCCSNPEGGWRRPGLKCLGMKEAESLRPWHPSALRVKKEEVPLSLS